MEALIAAHPEDLEAQLFLIKFLVTDAAGSFLDPDRGVGSGFDRARERLRPLLDSHPDSLAVHHYWIHAHEYGPEPEAALVSARKIPSLAPRSGHILHMPGHVFYKIGDYEGAYRAFHSSLELDREYLREQGIEPVDNWNYVHNLDYLVMNCAEDGRYREGRKWAEVLSEIPVRHERSAAVGLGFVIYGAHTATARLHMRYGRWQAAAESLAASLESSSFPSAHGADYSRGLLAYARGMAAVERGDGARAGQAFQEILGLSMALRQQRAELGSDWYFDVARRILAIASMELSGVLLSAQGQHDQAITFLERAVDAEGQLGYGEPPHVTRPVRESLAVAYLRAGRWQDARRTYEQVLTGRPGSGHAWYGIAKSHELAGQEAETRGAYERFLEAWRHGDDDLEEIRDARAWLAVNP
ncbi:MAG: tetratricopeptide repeat protein, partial [Thermoanaerobaculia bacterium]